jgi:hypothetical protein
MKTIADLKRRVVVGTWLKLDAYTISGVPASHKYMNIPRQVCAAQTNSFASKPVDDPRFPKAEASWCDWPKKAEFVPDDDGEGFAVNHGHIHLHYRIASA